MDVMIIGAGIGGLTLGLMLHRAGIPCRIYEAASELKAVGVGINILPHASRELCELGLEDALANVAITTREYCFYNRYGQFIYREPAGRYAGYDVPQFSIHRGDLQMVLLDAFVERAGADACAPAGAARGSIRTRGVAHFGDPATGKPLEPQRGSVRRGLRRHPFGDAQAALSGRRAAEIFRHQHVARRDALEADPVRRQHGAHRLAQAGEAADLSDPRRDRRRRPATRQLGGRYRDAGDIRSATGTGRGELEDFIGVASTTGISTGSTCRDSSAAPTRSSNIRWSIRTRCRAGASGRADAARRRGAPDVSARRQRRGAGDPRCRALTDALRGRSRSGRSAQGL